MHGPYEGPLGREGIPSKRTALQARRIQDPLQANNLAATGKRKGDDLPLYLRFLEEARFATRLKMA